MKRSTAFNLILIGCLMCSGCASVHNSLRPSGKSSQWNFFNRGTAEKASSKKKKSQPENMVVIWKDAVLEKPGTPPVRGFGARIFFHDADNQAIKVDGELVVFGFDDSASEGALLSKKPTKKFVFTNEQLQTHYSDSKLGGASYSIWIPWDKFGPEEKTIALVPIFKTAEGVTLNGGSTTNVLPSEKSKGKGLKEDKGLIAISNKSTKAATENQVSQAGFAAENSESDGTKQAVMNEEVSTKSKIKSTTINLPPSLSSHFSSPKANTQPSTTRPISEQRIDLRPRDASIESVSSGKEPSREQVTKNDLKQLTSETTKDVERSSGTTHTIKKSPVFGAPGSFR